MDTVIVSIASNKDKIEYFFDTDYPKKLIKYGADIFPSKQDIINITSNTAYLHCLNIDINDQDPKGIVKSLINIDKKFSNVETDREFLEFFEILKILQLTKPKSKIYVNTNKLEDIVKIFDFEKAEKNVSLVLYSLQSSDLEESVFLTTFLTDIKKIFDSQDKDCTMIVRFQDMKTQESADIVTYLSQYYEEVLLIKPSISSFISEIRYVVFRKLTDKKSLDNFDNGYIVLKNPSIVTDIKIKCINSILVAKKYELYQTIRNYIDSKIFEGFEYKKKRDEQHLNVLAWINKFIINYDSSNILDYSIKNTQDKCTISIDKIY
jgi:hypothetical protein